MSMYYDASPATSDGITRARLEIRSTGGTLVIVTSQGSVTITGYENGALNIVDSKTGQVMQLPVRK